MSTKRGLEKDLRQLGVNLRRERTSRGITQEKLAELADLNVRTLQKIEAGQTNILVTTFKRLCDGLNCDPNALLVHLGRDHH